MSSTPRFIYLRDYNQPNKHPIGCIVMELHSNSKQIKYAFSVCNPSDPWNRTTAKNKAMGRLTNNPTVIETEIPTSAHDVTRLVMNHIRDNNSTQSSSRSRSELAFLSANMWLKQARTDNTATVIAE